MNIREIIENADAPFMFDCPDCQGETEAYVRDDPDSACWIVCTNCYGRRWDGGMWEVDDVADRLTLA